MTSNNPENLRLYAVGIVATELVKAAMVACMRAPMNTSNPEIKDFISIGLSKRGAIEVVGYFT